MSLPSYIVNWEELIPMLQDLSENLTARGIKDVNGVQKVKGFAESIPAIQATYKAVDWTLPTNIVMTAVTVNQSSWVGSDYWELWIDGELIFETVFTKELGEQKHWEVVHPVAMGQNIKIILHNNTGNSRDIWSDIEYLEVGEFEVVEPEEPEEPEDGELIPDPDPTDPNPPIEPEEPEPEEPEEPIEPEPPVYSARVRIRYLEKDTLISLKPQYVLLNQTGILSFTGDEIEGWKLLEPKSKTIMISGNEDHIIDFFYERVIPVEPDEPDLPEVIDIPIRYFCDHSVSPSSVNTYFWNWNTLTTGSVSSQFGISLTGDFWRDRNSILEIFAVLGDPRTRRSKINETDFHKLLFKAWRDSDSYSINLNGVSWNQFQNWSSTELSCLTMLQKASLYYTIKTRIMTLIFQDGIDFTKGKIPDVISKFLAMLPNKVIDWIDYNDIAIDPANGLIGATSSDLMNENVPELFDAFQSYVNIEPSALLFGEEGLIGHNPYDYVNKSNDFWGMKIPRSFVDWSGFTPDGFASADHETKLGTIVAETVLHEYGHSVSYHFLNTHVGQVLHDTNEWKNIGGHNGSHLVKTRRADQTGGMPKTDSGREASPSDYGCSSPAEDFAESFCLYIANRPLLQAKYPQRYAFMEKYVKSII